MDRKKAGIMGGTFNPIHMGHLLLAETAREQAGLDEIWFIPSGQSYMKAGSYIADSSRRLAMAELATRDNPFFRVSDMEIARGGYTYTCDTLRELKKEKPDTDFYFIMGADCLFSIENWKEPETIFFNCTILAAARGDETGTEMESKRRELEERYGADIRLLYFQKLPISSTDIRERLAHGKSVRYLVPEGVRAYLEAEELYISEEMTGEMR